MTCGGCVVAAVGAVVALVLWWQSARTQRHLGMAFENNGMDVTTALVELPLVAVGGAVLPGLVWGLGAWLLTRRGRGRERSQAHG
ncbi:hypothetical protein ACGFY8_31950 [Streptomyces sp. NPDC048232]|uniref:hypothetical protein n=1 Tax=Streptomyces sp. NPDC048232 TaxID=3365520 RepID=UPI0037164EA0